MKDYIPTPEDLRAIAKSLDGPGDMESEWLIRLSCGLGTEEVPRPQKYGDQAALRHYAILALGKVAKDARRERRILQGQVRRWRAFASLLAGVGLAALLGWL